MSFKVVDEPTFSRKVTVQVPVDGGFRKETLDATFRVLPLEKFTEYNLNTEAGSRSFLQAVIVKLDDIAGDDGKTLPYSDELRDRVLGLPYARIALSRDYFEAVGNSKAGN